MSDQAQTPQNQSSQEADIKSAEEQALREREEQLDRIIRTREHAFVEEEKMILEWKAPARVFKARNRDYFTTIGAIVILVCIILLFIQEFLLMGVVISLTFVAYTFATIKPEDVTHKISSRGVRTGGKFYRWDSLGRFWFEDKVGQTVLYIETMFQFPRQLMLLIDKKDQEKIIELLAPYVLLEKPEPGFLDKAEKWMGEKIPLDSD